MKVIEDLNWRYATKKFDSSRSIDEADLQVLIDAFNLTATSYGLQPVKLVVVSNAEVKRKMVPHCYGQQQVLDASHVLVLCSTHVDVNYVKQYFDLVKRIRHTDEEILTPFEDFLKDSFSQKSRDEVAQWARNQAYLIMGNLLTVCATLRIDSCPMEGFLPDKIDDLLDLDKAGLHSVLLLPVGYRASDDMMSSQKKVRQPQEDMVRLVP
ncbi:MAG: NAD(P)H-dependent oxidoreductase [Nonlabens sp.]